MEATIDKLLKKQYLRCCAVILVALCAGCFGGVSLKRVHTEVSFQKQQGSALSSDGLSVHTAQLLRTYDLDKDYRKDLQHVLAVFREQACGTLDRSLLFGLSEFACYAGKRTEKHAPEEALGYYYSAARYAYFYLFASEFGAPPDPFDPRFRLACDLYNFSLGRGIRLMQETGRAMGDTVEVPLWDGAMKVHIERRGFLPEENIYRVLLASEYRVKGVRNEYRTYGLGVPLIALGTTPQEGSHLPDTPSYPATAFLKIEGGACLENDRLPAATLELYDSMQIQSVDVGDEKAPLESDLTTPLGYLLSNPELERAAYIGLLRASRLESQTGLYMLEPYQPEKIPVVMIHGLVSSPLAWAEMLNDLRGQPELREHYQFWFFMYPTGYPFAYPASQLRQALLDLRDTYDPNGEDGAFDEMVLIGHSMGGLIAQMLVQDSGTELWNAVSNKPLDQLNVTPEEEELIRSVFFFDALPFVKQVIFISTPHRGSSLSDGIIGTLVSALTAVPKALLTQMISFINRNPDAFKGDLQKRRLTSVDNLSPSNPIIEAMEKIPIAPWVTYHSIMGNVEDDPEKPSTDGVVPYSSSHLDGAASEKVVAAGHSAQTHPLTILEVRRILDAHLADLAGGPVQ